MIKEITIKVPYDMMSPEHLIVTINEMRANALTIGDFRSAIVLTHIHAWLWNCDRALADAEFPA